MYYFQTEDMNEFLLLFITILILILLLLLPLIIIMIIIMIIPRQGDESFVPFGLKEGVRKRRRMHTAPDKASG